MQTWANKSSKDMVLEDVREVLQRRMILLGRDIARPQGPRVHYEEPDEKELILRHRRNKLLPSACWATPPVDPGSPLSVGGGDGDAGEESVLGATDDAR